MGLIFYFSLYVTDICFYWESSSLVPTFCLNTYRLTLTLDQCQDRVKVDCRDEAKTMCFGIMTSFQYLKRTAARTSRLILKGEVWRNFWLLIETSAQWKLNHWSPQGNYCQNHKNWTFCWIEPIESNHSEFRMRQTVSAELKFGVIHVVSFYLLEKGRY